MKNTYEKVVYDLYSNTQAKAILKKIDWKLWIEGTGLPPWTANFTTSEEKIAEKLADDYISG